MFGFAKIFTLILVTFYSPVLNFYSSHPTVDLQPWLASMGEKVPFLSHTIPGNPWALDVVSACSVAQSFSRVQLFATVWTVAHKVTLNSSFFIRTAAI